MTTETAQAEQNDREKIWAELDAAETGRPGQAAAATAGEQTQAGEPADKKAKPDAGTAAAEPAASAADPAAAAATPDAQTLLDKVSGLEASLAEMTGRVRKVEGRNGELNSKLQQMESARETATAAGNAAPTATQIREAQQNPEKMTQLKKDYPEFGAAIEAVLDERLSGMKRELEELRAKAAQQPGSVSAEQIQALRNEIRVEIKHPEWQDTVRQPEFKGWLGRQSREVQLLAASDSPQDAIRLLDLHSESRKAAKPNNNTRLETAAAIPDGQRPTARTKPIEDMSKDEYWRYLDQQDAQKAQ